MDPASAPTYADHLFALLVGLVLPIVGAVQHRPSRADDGPAMFETHEKVALYWLNSLFLATLAGAALLVWWYGNQPIAAIGLAPPERVGAGLLLALLFLAAYGADTWRQLSSPERLAATRARWQRNTPFMPENAREIWHSMILVVAAAVSEELVYRGFLVSYCSAFTGSTPAGLAAAVALPSVVFALCHLYQGVHAVAKIAVLSTVFGAILVVTGSLWIPILLHFVVDLVGTLLAPKLLEKDAVD